MHTFFVVTTLLLPSEIIANLSKKLMPEIETEEVGHIQTRILNPSMKHEEHFRLVIMTGIRNELLRHVTDGYDNDAMPAHEKTFKTRCA